MVEPGVDDVFPGLRGQAYQVSSPKDHRYNCIAYAASDDQRWWWRDEAQEDTWPADVARAETVDAFRDAFATLGYVACGDDRLEAGYGRSSRPAGSPMMSFGARWRWKPDPTPGGPGGRDGRAGATVPKSILVFGRVPLSLESPARCRRAAARRPTEDRSAAAARRPYPGLLTSHLRCGSGDAPSRTVRQSAVCQADGGQGGCHARDGLPIRCTLLDRSGGRRGVTERNAIGDESSDSRFGQGGVSRPRGAGGETMVKSQGEERCCPFLPLALHRSRRLNPYLAVPSFGGASPAGEACFFRCSAKSSALPRSVT